MNRLRKKYKEDIVPKLEKKIGGNNTMAVPNLEKIVVNIGLGEVINNPQALEKMGEDIKVITGQKPLVTKVKKAISNFNIRPGMDIGLKVTLRRERMWDFFDKLITIVLPMVKDFRGLPRNSFDGYGNYTLGMKDHTIFSEIDPNKIDKIRSLEITIVTTARNDREGFILLEELGMPFAKESEARVLEQIHESINKEKKELESLKAKRLSEGKDIEDRRTK